MIRNAVPERVVALAVFALCLATAHAGGQTSTKSDRACSLLTASDLEKVLGRTLEKPLAGIEVPYKKDAEHDHDGAIFTCQGRVGARFVMVVFGPQPVTSEGRTRGEVRAKDAREKLLKSGYTIQEKGFGDLKCWTMEPPAKGVAAGGVAATTCAGTRGDHFYSIFISATGAGDLIPIENLKGLAGKAVSRLP
jgi:hypothetical protein